ncbi:unnamed protein product [Prunus armeniaca]
MSRTEWKISLLKVYTNNRVWFSNPPQGTPPVALRQLAILPHEFRGRLNRVVPVYSCYDIAPRVSGTLEPCGARIAAQAS